MCMCDIYVHVYIWDVDISMCHNSSACHVYITSVECGVRHSHIILVWKNVIGRKLILSFLTRETSAKNIFVKIC